MNRNHIHTVIFVTALLAALAFVSACSRAADSDAGAGTTLVLRNGSVFTATGDGPIPDAAIVIEDGRITAVGPEAEIEIPNGATVIDVEGRTILPGLIDTQVYVLEHIRIEDGKINTIDLKAYLMRALEGGVTTMRDTGSPYAGREEISELRAALDAQGNSIPTVLLTGPYLAHADGTIARAYPENTFGVKTTDEAREAASRLIESGVDQIKVVLHMRPTQMVRGEAPDEIAPSLSPEMLEAVVEVAHNRDVRVIAHAIDPREAEIAMAAGIDEIYNWPSTTQPLPEETLMGLVERSMQVGTVFTLLPPQPGDLRRFLDAGGTLLFGTAAPNAHAIHNPYADFEVMVDGELTATEIILSATAHAAEALGLGNELGTLEAGKLADIIVVDGNPLEDMLAIRDVVYVIKGGELVVSKVGQ